MCISRIKNLFNELYDVWHFFLGCLTAFLTVKVSEAFIVFFAIYVAYQSLEKESLLQTLRDCITFIFGILFILLLVK
jgi:hypothetical protein